MALKNVKIWEARARTGQTPALPRAVFTRPRIFSMTYETFFQLLTSTESPVVLLEGTRALPDADAPKLTALATRLARAFPAVRFRTGNATGSDEAFAAGVACVDPTRIEYVLPYAGHGKGRRAVDSPATGLDELPSGTVAAAAATTAAVSPKYRRATESYRDQKASHRERAIAQMILRDTVKVTGAGTLVRPTAGIFYVNSESPGDGGTGHTMRVCKAKGVPAITQFEWISWSI
jgi:hypothetical protein